MHRSIGNFNSWIKNVLTPGLYPIHMNKNVNIRFSDIIHHAAIDWNKSNVNTIVRLSARYDLTVMQMSHNYHYQSKICGNPFPRLNYLEPLARMQSDVDHRFSWKRKRC